MALITGIIGLVGHFAGQALNTTLGWATLLLFGKVPQKSQTLLLVIVFGSLVWIALVVGVVLPSVGTLLVAALPLPAFIDQSLVRLAMLIGALVLPLLIGIAAIFVTGRRDRSLIDNVVAVLRGYPFALVLDLVLVLLAAVGTWRKLRSLARRWTDAHIPIVVKPGGYDAVLADLTDALYRAGIDLDATDAGVLLSGPPKLLDLIAGRALGALVPDRLMLLKSKNLEVLVYPSDLAISGTKDLMARARAALAARVSDAPAYLTTSAESEKVEDRLTQIRHAASSVPVPTTLAALHQVDEQLAHLAVDHDEWETLYRLRLQIENELVGEEPAFESEAARGPSRLSWAIGLGGIALVALDVGVAVANRVRPPEASTAD